MLLLLLGNLCISIYNAWGTGSFWVEARTAGGVARLTAWAGAVMAAVGFTSCFTFVAVIIATERGWLAAERAQQALALQYLLIVIPLLSSGLVITAQSWAVFWRRRTFANGATASWNTLAQTCNTIQALDVVPDVLGMVGELFSGADAASGSDDIEEELAAHGLKLVLGVVVACLILGIFVTVVLVRASAQAHARRLRLDAESLAYARALQ